MADRRRGQTNLFEHLEEEESATSDVQLPEVSPLSDKEQLAAEKDALGFYMSSHPLAEFRRPLETYCSHQIADLGSIDPRSDVVVGGMLSAVRFTHTRKPRPGQTQTKYAMFDLEDTSGIVRCIIWPEQFAKFGDLIVSDSILVIRGKVDRRPGSDDSNIIVDEPIPIQAMEGRYTSGVRILLDEGKHGVKGLESLYEIIRHYPGKCDVELDIRLADGSLVRCECDDISVDLSEEMRGRLDESLGANSLQLLTVPVPRVQKNSQRAYTART